MARNDSKNGKVRRKKQSFTREDFFRDLKKVAKKQDRPSQPDSEKR